MFEANYNERCDALIVRKLHTQTNKLTHTRCVSVRLINCILVYVFFKQWRASWAKNYFKNNLIVTDSKCSATCILLARLFRESSKGQCSLSQKIPASDPQPALQPRGATMMGCEAHYLIKPNCQLSAGASMKVTHLRLSTDVSIWSQGYKCRW